MALWLDPMLSGPPLREIQMTRITYEHAYLIWIEPRRIELLDKYHLKGSSRQPDAAYAADVYWVAKHKLQAEVWQRCLTGELTVMATKSDGGFEILDPTFLNETWPGGPCVDFRFNQIEILGRTPDWLLQKPGDQSDFIHQIIPEFRATDDYQLVIIRKVRFELGAVQAGIVRALHRASFCTDQTLTEGQIRALAPFGG